VTTALTTRFGGKKFYIYIYEFSINLRLRVFENKVLRRIF